MSKEYNFRFIARIVLEATTPIAIGSGEKEINTDSAVLRDVNGLPYIPGSTLAGVIRHALEEVGAEPLDLFFGFQKGDEGHGSEILFSDAKMVGAEGKAIDGLVQIKADKHYKDFYSNYMNLPVRQHVRIGNKGVAEKHGKFDEEVVYKGTRFAFEIEVLSQSKECGQFQKVLDALSAAEIRFGHGGRKGFGKVQVVKEQSFMRCSLNLKNPSDLDWYLNHTSNLAEPFEGGESIVSNESSKSVVYNLTLKPVDFFLFGAAYGDEDADIVPVKEDVVVWTDDSKPNFEKKQQMLIPASSIKGALAHRVAYHYNRLRHRYADNATPEEIKAWTEQNEACVALFGLAVGKDIKRGNVLFEDIIEPMTQYEDKLFNHVAIDRFTGGALQGALFHEKATYGQGKEFTTKITLLKTDFDDEYIIKAFESALKDLTEGRLPLGGGVNKGHGCFKGECSKV